MTTWVLLVVLGSVEMRAEPPTIVYTTRQECETVARWWQRRELARLAKYRCIPLVRSP